MPHVSISELGQHWFRLWLVASNHHLNHAGILLIGPLGTNFNEIWIKIQNFSLMKMHLKMSSGKWQPFCPGGDELTNRMLCPKKYAHGLHYVALSCDLRPVNISTYISVISLKLRQSNDCPIERNDTITPMLVMQSRWISSNGSHVSARTHEILKQNSNVSSNGSSSDRCMNNSH